MTNMELILNMFAEAAATEISLVEQPVGYSQSADIAKRGADTARVARKKLEEETGKSAISNLNAKELKQKKLADKTGGEED